MKIINEADRIVHVPLKDLKEHPRNPNRGDVDAIEVSINENGFYGAVVAQKSTGYILAGNHRYKAARNAKAKSLPVIWVDVDDKQALKILLADNRTAELAHRDDELLAGLLQEMQRDQDLLGTGYSDADLEALLAELGIESEDETPEAPEAQIDRAEELREKWGVEYGQLWKVGRHRILCGDSTKKEDVERLLGGEKVDFIFADPPYGISIVSTVGTTADKSGGGAAYKIPFGGKKVCGTDGAAKPFGSKKARGTDGAPGMIDVGYYSPVIGDDTTGTAEKASALYLSLFPRAVHIWWGGNYYANTLPSSPCWIIWDKENGTSNFADAEIAWTNQKTATRIFRHMWNGLMKASERSEKRVHPTQKPAALAEWCLEKYGDADDVVLDPFLGSGMSLVACESKCRSGCGIEMAEEYVAVSLQRLADMGLEAELINA